VPKIKLDEKHFAWVKDEIHGSRENDKHRDDISISLCDLYLGLVEDGFTPVERVFESKPDATRKPKNSIYVDYGHAAIANGTYFLATDGLGPCAALRIVYPIENLDYLLHSFPSSTSVGEITQSIIRAEKLGMNLADSEFNVMPGSLLQFWTSIKILEAIYRIDPSLLENVSLVRDIKASERIETQGLVVHGGARFQYPSNIWCDDFDYRTKFNNLARKTLAVDGFEQLI
jgi:hypothetical protein